MLICVGLRTFLVLCLDLLGSPLPSLSGPLPISGLYLWLFWKLSDASWSLFAQTLGAKELKVSENLCTSHSPSPWPITYWHRNMKTELFPPLGRTKVEVNFIFWRIWPSPKSAWGSSLASFESHCQYRAVKRVFEFLLLLILWIEPASSILCL